MKKQKIVCFRLESELNEEIEKISKETGLPKAQLIRLAIVEFIKKIKKEKQVSFKIKE